VATRLPVLPELPTIRIGCAAESIVTVVLLVMSPANATSLTPFWSQTIGSSMCAIPEKMIQRPDDLEFCGSRCMMGA
jgi:hypothetical protein